MSETPAERGPAEPRWHRRKEARPVEILDAALLEFAARGFAAARLEDIAHRAGCTKGTIFLYFENKEELFKALVRHTALPAIEQSESLADRHEGSSADLLRALMHSRWDMMVNSSMSAMPKLLFSEAGNFPELSRFYMQEIVARSHGLIDRVLRAGVESGEFRSDLDTHATTRVAMAPLLVASLWKHSFEAQDVGIDLERYFNAALDLLLHGIARTQAGGDRS